jgi:hypothetical protein
MRRVLIALIILTIQPTGSARFGRNPAPQATPVAGQSRWFFVAVLRSDGVVVPFATYWRGLWLAPWQPPPGYPPEINSVSNLPSPWFTKYEKTTPIWHATGAGARQAVTLHASKLLEVDNHCSTNWGWQTDYAGAEREEGQHESVGIAINEPAVIVAPARLDPHSAELKPIISLILRRFESDERSWLARPDMAWRAKSVPRAGVRAKQSPAVVKLYRIGASGGRTLYSFQAERRYAKPRGSHDPGCESLSAFAGILLQESHRIRLVERQFALSDCDAKEVTYSLPLGLIRDGGRDFLILQEQGYEDESYTILELLRGGLLRRLRRVEGGGC